MKPITFYIIITRGEKAKHYLVVLDHFFCSLCLVTQLEKCKPIHKGDRIEARNEGSRFIEE